MSDTYTKLFRSLAASTIVEEPLAARWLWVMLLSQSDARGCVYASVPGLARLANLSIPDVEQSLARFMSPDTYSRTKDHDGRRIEEIDGGWRLLNHAKYAAIRSAEERRDYKREWDRAHRPSGNARQSDKSPTESDSSPTKSDGPTPLDLDLKKQLPIQETLPRSVGEGVQGDASRKRSADQRGTRLPDDWQPSEEQLAWARLERPDCDISMEAESFADHWRAQPGQRGRKSDWPATWRNWVRRARARPAQERAQARGRYGGAPTLPERMQMAATAARAAAARVVGSDRRALEPVTIMQALDYDPDQ